MWCALRRTSQLLHNIIKHVSLINIFFTLRTNITTTKKILKHFFLYRVITYVKYPYEIAVRFGGKKVFSNVHIEDDRIVYVPETKKKYIMRVVYVVSELL